MKYIHKVIFSFLLSLLAVTPVYAQTTSFRFASWADTKGGLSTLNALSKQMVTKSPLFLFYPGDVCDSGPTTACLATWASNYNAGGDLLSKSFPSRGNHDSGGTSVWTSYFNIAAVASAVGATNLSQLSTNLTYSFDYGNSHFVAVDMPGGDATSMSTAQLNWVDTDLTQAESRGAVHSFLFWHGPEYPMGGHCCSNNASIPAMLTKHQSVSATFHGHEHNLAYSHIDATKFPGMTRSYEEFTIGAAGAGLYGCQRGDWCQSTNGFAIIDVNGNTFTVNIYNQSGSVIKTVSVTKSATGTTSTPTPVSSPTPTRGTTPTPTPTPGGTSLPGDLDGNRKVDIFDYNILVTNFGKTGANGFTPADIDRNGKVDIFDYNILVTNFGRSI